MGDSRTTGGDYCSPVGGMHGYDMAKARITGAIYSFKILRAVAGPDEARHLSVAITDLETVLYRVRAAEESR